LIIHQKFARRSIRPYTLNIIESLNSVIRCVVAHRKLFLSDELVIKVIYLAISQAAKKWIMPIQNWRITLNRFMIQLKVRIQKYDH
jgi:putative transposase